MASSHSATPNSQPVSKDTKGKSNTSEDEIDLTDYLKVVWRRKYLIALGTVLPSLLVYLGFFFSPSNYRVAYTYDITRDERDLKVPLSYRTGAENADRLTALSGKDELFEKERRMLLDRFYGTENLDKLADKLRENGFGGYAQGISQAKIQLEVSDSLLTVTMIGGPREDMQKISSIVRDNFERVLPIYSVKQELSGNIAKLKTEMAAIEEGKFSLELDLERKKAILARLKSLASTEPGMALDGLVLHFESVRENSEYLPLRYQVQATDANIINIEQTIRANQERYDYYGAMLSLNESLLEEVRNNMSSYYTIGEFHSFLARIMGDYEGSDLRSYLSAYIKKIENAMSANTPIIETPRITPVPKGGLKKAGIVFVGLLMMTTFGAFLLDVAQKGQKPGGVKSS